MDHTTTKTNQEFDYVQGFIKNKNNDTISSDLTKVNLFKAYIQNMVSGKEFIKKLEKNLNIEGNQSCANRDTTLQKLRFMNQMGLTHIMPNMLEELEDNNQTSILDELTKQNIFSCDSSKRTTIALDGPSSCGKSTIINHFWHKNKISNYIDHLSDTYNYKPTSALCHALLNLRLLTESENMVLDRSPIANLAYQLCYYIMNCLSNSDNKKDFRYTFTALCKEYIEIHNLTPWLEYLNGQKLNIIIILDSDFEQMGKRLFQRGLTMNSSSDMMRSVMDCYLKAQNAAFAYLANELNYYTLDLNFYRLKYSRKDNILKEAEIFNAITIHLRNVIERVLVSIWDDTISCEKFAEIVHSNTFAETPERILNNLAMLVHSNR